MHCKDTILRTQNNSHYSKLIPNSRIPSLVGYMSLALVIYKVGIKPLNRLLEWTNRFSYEWYLVHMFVFDIIFYCIGYKTPIVVVFMLCLLLSYSTAIAYSKIWSK